MSSNLIGINKTNDPMPFLRWAGGKSWLLKYLENLKYLNYRNYHEPFIGGGAVFLFLNPSGYSYLSDLNDELIGVYSAIKENVDDVISILKSVKNSEDYYYNLRSKNLKSPSRKAARFIYLNQSSFNGIYRVNLKGKYNVPFGFRKNINLDHENLKLVSQRLEKSIIKTQDFELSLENVGPNDLVFIDPPYTVSHNNNGFIKYNQKLFTLEDQFRLADYIREVKARRAYYILTNAAHQKVKEIFGHIDPPVELSRPSLVGGKNAKRGLITEYIFSNIKIL